MGAKGKGNSIEEGEESHASAHINPLWFQQLSGCLMA